MAVIEVKGLSKSYQDGETKKIILNSVNLLIEEGRFVAIIGKSGTGKSTLLHILGGLDEPDEGEILVSGKQIHLMKDQELSEYRAKDIGFVFQSYNLIPVLTAWENIILPAKFAGLTIDKEYVNELMALLQIADKKDTMPSVLSGGQQQRVAIARALVNKPRVIFADEPTGNLDSETGKMVLHLFLEGIKRFHQTLVMVTHDMEVAQYADERIQMDQLC